MLQTGLQHIHVAVQRLVRLGNGLQGHLGVVVLEVLVKQHGVVPLLLGLNLVPVGEAVQAPGLKVVGKIQVQIGGVKLLVDLLVQQGGDLFTQHNNMLPSSKD